MAIIHKFKPINHDSQQNHKVMLIQENRETKDVFLIRHPDGSIDFYVGDDFLFSFTPVEDPEVVMGSVSRTIQAIHQFLRQEQEEENPESSMYRSLLLLRDVLVQGLWHLGTAYADELPGA